jgi:hypothetical protein
MVDPYFVIIDGATHEGATFLMILVYKVVTDVKTEMTNRFHLAQALWN